MEQIVGALIIKSNRILLGLRAPGRRNYPGVWDIFGGHVEAGESKDQALVRELQEELGIILKRWTEFETLFIPHYETAPDRLRLNLYLAKDWSGTPENRQPHEHSALGWFTLEQALKLKRAVPAYEEVFKRCFLSEERA
ncbi:MAG: NUDIX domain-containing protein [Desulfobacteraceae bacterium]|nr:MAG: NUDIX domain-containing protein [Desulfobacteraceae bacterium]